MPESVKNLRDLIGFAAQNPHFAKQLKADPKQVALMFGLELTIEDAEKISANLDIDQLLRFSTDVNSMAAKVAQGVGLRLNE